MVPTPGPKIFSAKSMSFVVNGIFVHISILIIDCMSAIADVIVHDRVYAPSLHIETVVHGRIIGIFE